MLDKSGSRPGTVDKDYIEERVINTLNYYYFNSAHLCFISMGSDYINYISSSFTLANNYKELFNLNHVSGALNIYIPYKTYSGTFSGVAKDIISNACVIQLDRYDSTTVPHEIGHCFGLYHTHTGTAKLWHSGYYDGENTVPEYVDGSNSTIAGDYIADTDADPNLWSIRGTYSGGPNVVDGHGQQYKPDPQNLMSYNG
ncbi:MAG: hypothetical protein K2F62_03345, partial [Muribaculaceae bacterium]|nr:hypothetical protein [Muribaculaceae bacterium]